MSNRNDILYEIGVELGADVSETDNMNEILAAIVVAAGGQVSNPSNRNALLMDYLSTLNNA